MGVAYGKFMDDRSVIVSVLMWVWDSLVLYVTAGSLELGGLLYVTTRSLELGGLLGHS